MFGGVRLMNMRLRISSALIGILALIVSFQNCGGFSPQSESTASTSSNNPAQGTPSGIDPNFPPQPSSPSPTNLQFLSDPKTIPDSSCLFFVRTVQEFRDATIDSSKFDSIRQRNQAIVPGHAIVCLDADLDFGGEDLIKNVSVEQQRMQLRSGGYFAISHTFNSGGQSNIEYVPVALAGRGHSIKNFRLTMPWPFPFSRDLKLLDWSADLDLRFPAPEMFMYSASQVSLLSSFKNSIVLTTRPIRISSGFQTNCVGYLGSGAYVPLDMGCGVSQAALSIFNDTVTPPAYNLEGSIVQLDNALIRGGKANVGGHRFKDSKVKINLALEAVLIAGTGHSRTDFSGSTVDLNLKAKNIASLPELQFINTVDDHYLFSNYQALPATNKGTLNLNIELLDFKNFNLFTNYVANSESVFRDLDINLKLKTRSSLAVKWKPGVATTTDTVFGLNRFKCPTEILNSRLNFEMDLGSRTDAGLNAAGLCEKMNDLGMKIEKSQIRIKLQTASQATDIRFSPLSPNGKVCHRSAISGLVLWRPHLVGMNAPNCPVLDVVTQSFEIPHDSVYVDPFTGTVTPGVPGSAGINLVDSEINVYVEPKLDRAGLSRSQAGGIFAHHPGATVTPWQFSRSKVRTEVVANANEIESSALWLMENFGGGSFATDSESTNTVTGNIKRSIFERN